MFYNIINSRKFRFKRTLIIYLMFISYMATFNSCMTTENIYVTPDYLDSASIYEITKIKLKDGTSIDCADNKIIKLKKDSDSALFFDISSYTVGENYKTIWTNQHISVRDIYKIQLEKSVLNTAPTVVILVISAAVLTFFIMMSIAVGNL